MKLTRTEDEDLFLLTGIGLLQADMITGRFIGANRTFCEMVGYSEEEVQGMTYANLTYPEDRERFAALQRGELHEDTAVTRVLHKDGHEVWLELHVTVLSEGAGVINLTVVHDVNERNRVEKALRDSEVRFRSLVEPFSQAVWEANAEGQVVADSPSWRAYTGQSLESGLGEGWADAVHPDDRAYALRQWREAVRAGTVVDAEFRLRSPDGGWRWTNVRAAPLLRDDGTVESWVGLNIDISERKRAEEASYESELRLQLALEAANMGTFLYHIEEDRGEPDARMLALFGLPEGGELNLAVALTELIHPEDRAGYAEAVARATDPAGDGRLQSDIRVIHPGDHIRWVSVMAQVVFDGEPRRPVDMYGTAIDITERKQQEQRQAFLLTLGDALRRETSVEAVGNRAVGMIAEALGLDRVYLVSVTPGDDNIVVTHEVRRADMPPLLGSYRGSDFPDAMKQIFEQTIVYDDVRTDPRLGELDRRSLAGLGAVGFIAAPILRGEGEMIWAGGGLSTQPRSWSANEVALFEDAIERSWLAVERIRAEAALYVSEEKYRMLFSSIDEGFCIFELLFDDEGNAVDWVYTEANPAFEKQTGYIDPIGKRISHFQPDLERSWFERFAKVARTGEPVRFAQYTEAMGIYYDVYALRVGEAGENRVSLLFTDITERKRAEAKQAFLLELSDMLRPLADPAKIQFAAMTVLGEYLGALRVQYYEAEPDDEHVLSSGGYVSGQGTVVTNLILMDDFGSFVKAYFRAGVNVVVSDAAKDPRISKRDLESYDMYGFRAYVAVPLVKDGRFVACIGVHNASKRNWTDLEVELIEETAERTWAAVERARAEASLTELNETLEQQVKARTQELERSNVRFNQAFTLAPFPAIISTLGKGEMFLEVNEAFLALTRYAREEIIGKHVFDLNMWSSVEDQKRLDEAQKDGLGFRDLPLQLKDKQGNLLDVLLSTEVIRIDGHEGYLKMFYDVTDKKRTDEQMMEAVRSLMTDATWFSQEFVSRLNYIRSGGKLDDYQPLALSAREREVLKLLAQGWSNKRISDGLGLKQQTIRNYVSAIFDKIGVHSRTEAAVWARERGLIG